MSWFKGILTSITGVNGPVSGKNEQADSSAPSPFSSSASSGQDIEEMRAARKENTERMEESREKRDEKEKIEDDLKFVIDGAKLECSLCSNPRGVLRVNLNTPSIQNKRTATVVENNKQSVVFSGTCSKSANGSAPCTSVMQLGEWKDTGSSKVQGYNPLLLKSTITCNYGGVKVKITDCGQRNEPDNLNVAGAPVPKDEKPDFDIKLELQKKDAAFLPLGIADFSGKTENKLLRFKLTVTGKGINEWRLDIKDDTGIIYTGYSATGELNEVNITGTTKSDTPASSSQGESKKLWPAGEYDIVWDGFDNQGIYLNTRFLKSGLTASITGISDTKRKTAKTEKIKFKRSEVDWVDVKIDKKRNRVDVTLRVDLADGGAKGIDCISRSVPNQDFPIETTSCPWDKIPKDRLTYYKREPIKERVKSFEELTELALAGIAKHWSRNSKGELIVGKNILIDDQEYEVFVNPVNTKDEAMGDVDLIFNTNNSWMRSGNPGSVKDLITAVGNLVSREAICYNVGYIKYSNGWGYQSPAAEDLVMKDTAAHEIGHEILKKYGGTIYSYGHKGSVNTVFQYKYSDAPEFPMEGEIDLMPYFADNVLGGEHEQPNYYNRRVAAQKDVLGLIWLSKLTVS